MMTMVKDLREAAEIFRDNMDRLLQEGVSFPSKDRAHITAINHLNKVIGMQVDEEEMKITLLCNTQSGFGYYTLKGEVISIHLLNNAASYFIMVEETDAVSNLPEKKDWIGSDDFLPWEDEDDQLY